jgi:tRNA pseudouridine55 synthase
VDGVIVVDKPSGWTSHDVVNKVRRFAGTKKVGHLGTLDPSATGVLPLVVGRATRLAQFYTRHDKVYEGVIRFGFATDTYDAEGAPTSPEQAVNVTAEQLEPLLAQFRGKISQVPPAVSAKKIAGRPAYELARKNIAVELKPVEIEIFSLDLLGVAGNQATIRLHCSSGTYVRSIAHDLGQALGCGAHLQSLRRTASGDFTLPQARTLDQLAQLAESGRIAEALIPAAQLLPEFPSEHVDDITAAQIRNGRAFRVSAFQVPKTARYLKAVNSSGDLIAIGEARLPHLYHPVLVL